MPGLGKAGGKIVFATTDINTASTHELVDRVTIDSKGRFMQRSTAKTGVAYHIRASEITTGTALNVQAPNLRSGIGMHITTEIARKAPIIFRYLQTTELYTLPLMLLRDSMLEIQLKYTTVRMKPTIEDLPSDLALEI